MFPTQSLKSTPIAIALALCAAWASPSTAGSAPPRASSKLAFCLATTPYPRIDNHGKPDGPWLARHQSFNAQAAKGGFDVLFVGDSITQAWEGGGKAVWDRELAPLKSANFGISGDRTEHVLWRLDYGNLDGKLDPKVIVVMIGTNNTGHRMDAPDDIAAGIAAIVQRLTTRFPSAHIILHGIFPCGATPADGKRMNNDKTNAMIAKLDGSSTGHVHYLDISRLFLDKDGSLPKSLMPDLLHPNPAGYEIWAQAVVPEIRKLLARSNRGPNR